MSLSARQYRGLGRKEARLLLRLAETKNVVFALSDAQDIVGPSAKNIVRGLVKKKWVLRLKRGLYVIVPLDMGLEGADAFLMHEFVIASFLTKSYYIAYWSALNHHGLTDQIPRTVFVATTTPKHPLHVLNTEYRFVKLSSRKFFGWEETEIESREVRISDGEKTVVDCLDHPENCGGIEQIAMSIYFYHVELDFERVVQHARKMGNATILKRLGYILENLDMMREYGDYLTGFIPTKGYPKLDPLSPRRGKHDSQWNLLVNCRLDPEGWMY